MAIVAALPAAANGLEEDQLRSCTARVVLQMKAARYQFGKHEFVCKGLTGWKTDKSSGATAVKGQLSHHLTARPDDQINWTATITREGAVEDLKMTLKRGGAGKLLDWPVKAIAAYYGKTIDDEQMRQFFSTAGKLWDGKWETTGEIVVAGIVANIAHSRARRNADADFSTRPIFHYQLAPRSASLAYRWTQPKWIYDCRRACQDDAQCAVWSYENRTLPDGDRQPFCSLYTSPQTAGIKPQMRTVSGRIRN